MKNNHLQQTGTEKFDLFKAVNEEIPGVPDNAADQVASEDFLKELKKKNAELIKKLREADHTISEVSAMIKKNQ